MKLARYKVGNILIYSTISHFDFLVGGKVERAANIRLIPAKDKEVQARTISASFLIYQAHALVFTVEDSF